jgi:hypothetical protein
MTEPATFESWTRLVVDRGDPYAEQSRREAERRLVRKKADLLKQVGEIDRELDRIRGIR